MIEKRERRDRDGRTYTVYRVRAVGVDRTLPRGTTRKQAQQWETKVKQAAQTGELDQLDAGMETLAEFVAEWWTTYADANLAHATLQNYKIMWERHLVDRVGELSGQHQPVEKLIAAARRPRNVPTSTGRRNRLRLVSLYQAKPSTGLEPVTPSLPWKCSTN